MSRAMADFLDGLSAAEQRAIIRLATAADVSSLMVSMLTAVAVEVSAQVSRDLATLARLEQDHLADVEQRAADLGVVDPAPPAGKSASFDPDTREWRFDDD